MLGFRGHFLTKSRRYSTTFGAIRDERRTWRLLDTLDRLARDTDDPGDDPARPRHRHRDQRLAPGRHRTPQPRRTGAGHGHRRTTPHTPHDREEDDMDALTYTVDEVAALLGVARGVAYEGVRNGSIPATRVGRRWLIPRRRFHAWLDGSDAADDPRRRDRVVA